MPDEPKPIKMQLPNSTALKNIAASKGQILKDGSNEAAGLAYHSGLAKSSVAYMPLRYAQSASGVTITQPMFFSPMQTPQNWQIASKRREVYQWARFYYENEPKVAAAIDFYSQFPINGFKLECKKRKVLRYFERLVDRLELLKWLRLISHERFLLGDVFVFSEVTCPHCHGSGKNPDDPESECLHPDGTFKRLIVMNPDWIEVYTSPLADEPEIVFLPDDDLKKIVQTRQPKKIFDKMPEQVKALIAGGRPIRLDSRLTSHIKHNGVPYGTYGESLLRRLFTTLAYKTKLMTANWIVAERLILPVRVVKIGDKDRPAGEDDISEVTQYLSQVANDPNLTIVTHHAFDYEWYGASGKIHNINAEMELIGKEILDGLMLNQALLNGEMGAYACLDESTLTLTDSGFKKWDEISEADKIACFNPDTKKIEYHHYVEKHVYDHSGEMVKFQTDKIDICVTPNHRMWAKKRDSDTFEFVRADEVSRRCKFIGTVGGFDGEYESSVQIGDTKISTYDYCEMAGFFVSEAWTASEKRSNRKNQTTTISIGQVEYGKAREQISTLFDRTFDTHYETEHAISVYKPDLATHFRTEYGSHATKKRLPAWLKNLSTECLEILIQSMLQGDGYVRTRKGRADVTHSYCTSSDQLAKDFAEIAFKCGYVTKIVKRAPYKSGKKYFNKGGYEFQTQHPQYVVHISKGRKGQEPSLQSKSKKYANKEIQRVTYDGKVYCFTVPHGLFVTMREGKITIQGNSAQIGAETMIRRLETWRSELKDWVEKYIFLPIAKMQGFIDEDESKEAGEVVYLYPQLKWEDMNLRDNSNDKQMMIGLNQNGKISDRTLLEFFDLNYDQEVERLREQNIMAQQNGMVTGGAGGPGGMGAPGIGGPGGAGGGGAVGPMGGPGGAPGMGGPDMGGGMMGGGAPGGTPGGGMMGGGAPMGAAAGGPTPGKVYKKGKAPKAQEPDEATLAAMQPKQVPLTQPEAKLLRLMQSMRLPFGLYVQFKQQVPGEQQPFAMDFAIPDIRLDIEADGEKWHTNPEDKQSDNERDMKLAHNGWTVIRFPESAINENMQQVQKVLEDAIASAVEARQKSSKKASIQGLSSRLVVSSFENPLLADAIERGFTSIVIPEERWDEDIKTG